MYAKIRLYNEFKGTIHSVSVPTWGANENEATENVKKMVENWQGITSFSILKISRQPILIDKFFVETELYYRNGSARTIKLNLTAETEQEAREISEEIIKCWNKSIYSHRVVRAGLRG